MLLLDNAIKYVDDVLSGKEVTTWEIIEECKRFKEDYEINQYKENFEFYFDKEKLLIINNLLTLLNFATGFVAGKPVLDNLASFQSFFIANTFGWRYKDKPYKFKHNDITLYIARKNAKTALVGIVFILLMLTEQSYSEFYSICVSKELAAEIRKSMVQILEASPAISKYFTWSATITGKIECKLTHSFFHPRTAQAGKNNSIRPSAFVSDEHAFFTDKSNFLAMKSGQKNVLNPLVFRTTTAYPESNSIMIDDLTYIRDNIKNNSNPRQFALLYYAEKENLWNDTGILQANPLRIEENYNTIRENRERAIKIDTEKTEYLTKEMNVMVESNDGDSYLDMKYWYENEIDSWNISGQDVVIGLDLSLTTDLSAISIMYYYNGKYYCNAYGFLPRESLESRREKFDYIRAEERGECFINDGAIVDYRVIEDFIRNIESKFNCNIKCIVSDPFNATELLQRLSEDYDVIFLKQNYTNLSAPTKEFRNYLYSGKVKHIKNKLYDWNFANTSTAKDKLENEMLTKINKNKMRIDLAAATIFAFSQLYLEEDDDWAIQII